MKLREYRDYSNGIVDSFSEVSKKSKIISLIFTIVTGLLCVSPVICIFVNLFIQFLGVKYVVITLISLCGILLHLVISCFYPVYFISLNVLNNNIDSKLSYKKLFIVSILDLFQIVCILIMITLMNVLVINMLF